MSDGLSPGQQQVHLGAGKIYLSSLIYYINLSIKPYYL